MDYSANCFAAFPAILWNGPLGFQIVPDCDQLKTFTLRAFCMSPTTHFDDADALAQMQNTIVNLNQLFTFEVGPVYHENDGLHAVDICLMRSVHSLCKTNAQ